jgi:hypothetical protein
LPFFAQNQGFDIFATNKTPTYQQLFNDGESPAINQTKAANKFCKMFFTE